MENASKALIIAGAILLAILLISLGIMIFGQASDTVTNNQLDGQEVTAYNNRFLKYEGNSRKGSEVKQLVNDAIAANAEDRFYDNQIRVKVSFGSKDLTNVGSSDILTSKTYTVKMKNYSKGRISEIEVTENK